MSEQQKFEEIQRFSKGVYTSWAPHFQRTMVEKNWITECEAMHLSDKAIHSLCVQRPELYPVRAAANPIRAKVRSQYQQVMR